MKSVSPSISCLANTFHIADQGAYILVGYTLTNNRPIKRLHQHCMPVQCFAM